MSSAEQEIDTYMTLDIRPERQRGAKPKLAPCSSQECFTHRHYPYAEAEQARAKFIAEHGGFSDSVAYHMGRQRALACGWSETEAERGAKARVDELVEEAATLLVGNYVLNSWVYERLFFRRLEEIAKELVPMHAPCDWRPVMRILTEKEDGTYATRYAAPAKEGSWEK